MLLLFLTFFLSLGFYFILKNVDIASHNKLNSVALRNAYHARDKIIRPQTSTSDSNEKHNDLRISELFIYPVKSLRGLRVSSAVVTPQGFYLDRKYMLLKVGDETSSKPISMQVSRIPAMALFETSISTETNELFTITYHGDLKTSDNSIELPFEPTSVELAGLDRVQVDMYTSGCLAYDMGANFNEWFSTRFGFRVILAFWGGNPRPVLGNLPGKASNDFPKPRSLLMKTLKSVPLFQSLVGEDIGIAFNDMAPFLVINNESVKDVSRRLGKAMDATKFRPNIIVTGAKTAYEEDYWAEAKINPDGGSDSCRLQLTANCVRCASLNVAYNGKWAEGKEGEVLKLLQKDRRVDAGIKHSPVFGRYGFPGRGDVGKVLKVGDRMVISKRNEERTTFAWKGYNA